MALEKARIQLLNPDTGAVVEEVDILSTASVISYVNNEKTVRDFRGIPAGTTFKEEDEVSVKDVLDRILYPYQEMEIESIAGVDGKAVSQDTIIYKEKYYPVESYTYSAKVKVGNVSRLTFQLKRYNNITGDVTSIDSTVTVTPGSTYLYTQEVKDITNDTSLQLTINDGENITVSPTVEFKFIYPVYVGYCDLSLITGVIDTGIEIDTQKATDYFNTLIANKSPLIEKRLLPVQDIQSIVLNDPIYSNQEYHPCILYPNTWHKVEAITDCNEDIITGAFYYNNQLSIKPDNVEVHKGQYTVYASIDPYNVQLAAAKAIVYRFELGTGSINYGTVGVPTLTGFDPLNHHPLDLRLEANTYDDLVDIDYKYDGMIVFVHDLQSYFRYDEKTDMWINTNQELLFGSEIPSLDLGKSGDVYFNIATGHIYQKYKDVRWEDKGVITVNLSDDILKSVDMWQSDKTYQPGEYVFWNGKYWKSQSETTSEPGTDNTWVETKPTIIQGPEGDPGEAATVEIVETLVTDNPDDADVINLGDKFHARLRFIVPRGPVGPAADPEILYQIQEVLNNNESIMEQIQQKILTVNNDIDEVREDNINIKKDLNTAKTNINTINKNIDAINEKNAAQDTEISNIKKDINSINQKNTEQDTEITNIKNKNQSQDTEIENIKNKTESQDTEISNIKTSIEEIKSSSSDSINTITENITNITEKTNSHDTEISNIKSDITSINEKNTSQDTEIENIKTVIQTLDSSTSGDISTIIEKLNVIDDKNTTQDDKITALEQSVSSINTKIDSILAEIENLKNIIPTGTSQEGTTLKFINSSNTTLFETTVTNGIPLMVNGELDYSDPKTAYLELEEGSDYYIMKFQ